jgi:beta-mannosidase
MRYSLILMLVVIFGCQPQYDVPITIEIDKNWKFRQISDSLWYSATIPGDVYSDLLNNKLIEDPFIGSNEQNVQWVSDTKWEYKTRFNLDPTTLSKNHLQLLFDGLDTYALVYLNDSLILNANNAFRQWCVNAKPLLKAQNEVRIIFEPTAAVEVVEQAKLSYVLPEGNRVFTRKPQFQYGWDWAPELNTAGIVGPIKLQAWDNFKIEDVYVKQFKLNDSISHLMANVQYQSETDTDAVYELYINDSLIEQNPIIPNYELIIPFQIAKPKLWWPHNLGEPYLYDIKVLVKQGRRILDSITVKKGLRTIELVTDKDSIGESFYFKVNGVPVYAKGANYIPQHGFQNRVEESDYERVLDDVVRANMNMLRVWGGGLYEEDQFYELCDEKGIMVWQDFMFACAMYPGDDAFLRNVQNEAQEQVKRLRNHASLVLWCGNNENSEGWNRWGWQANRSTSEKKTIWTNYLKLFDSILPITVQQLTDIPYWESSPKFGRGDTRYQFEGDAHDWWVWHDGYSFEHFEETIPRFMSEFGMQAFPSFQTIRFINQKDSLDISSEGFKNHQKHLRGFQLINDYMGRDFPVPEHPEDYVYMSQLVQAHGITKGIEAHRRARPYNMGTLYWQLNDCWPAISWSSIDFFGNWKALHYKAKRSFENVLISTRIENEKLYVWLINDNLEPLEGELVIELMDFSGERQKLVKKTHTAAPGTSEMLYNWSLVDFNLDASEVVLITAFNDSKRIHWLEKPKQLKLQQQPISQKLTKIENGYRIDLRSTTLQKDVFLFTTTQGHFSDNFFNMLPDETYSIYFQTPEILEDLQVKSFNNFIR